MKSLILSDIHLGSLLFNGERFLIELLDHEYKEVYILGDILDVWVDKLDNIKNKYGELIHAINLKATRCPVIIVRGNHDPELSILKQIFYNCEVNNTCKITKDSIYIHGNQFDEFIIQYSYLANFLYRIHLIGERFGLNIREYFRKLFFSISSKRDKDYYNDLVLDIERAAYNKYRDSYKNIIMGHTHLPKIVSYPYFGNIRRYINSGDWIHSMSYVLYDNITDSFNLYKGII